MHRFVLLFAAIALVLGGGVAAADPPSPEDAAGRSTDILGVVPAQAFAHGGGGGKGGNNLVYHNGPVLRTNRTVSIYWGPSSSFGSGYQSTINQYFTDVAAASGQSSNVYSVLNQYYDLTGGISYSSTFGGQLTDTSAYTNDCSDAVSQTTVCVSDAQIRAAVARNVPNPDSSTVYFVFTGKNVGSCYNSSTCAFSYYCAYHSSFSSGGKTWIYANQPYADTVPSACDAGLHPNGGDADATINVASHEHREAINDPFGNAWYDRRGYEGSDKCAWNFGTLSGPDYNQTINGHNYILQQEWSNLISGCALSS